MGAVKALDANSVALAKTVGSVYPEAEKPFLASWRQHIGFFVNYTLGKATKNEQQAAKAKADLDNYRKSFGELINSVIPELPADAVAKELVPHVNTLIAAIDADIAGTLGRRNEIVAHALDIGRGHRARHAREAAALGDSRRRDRLQPRASLAGM